MEEFNIGHHNPKPSNSLPQMDLFSNLSAAANSSMDQSAAANFNSSLHHGINIPLSNQGFSDHHQHHHHHHAPFSSDEISRSIGPIFDHMSQFFPPAGINMMPEHHEIMANSSPSVSGTGFLGPGKNYGGNKKRKRLNEREIEKPREVVHVRAKRGQATDSHSLAERLRREKINEKLRCLQDLVPGCYKTMGMAVMLDVIINYVRSLQNQIDFLSMKLSAASLFYDFNSSEAEAIETIQGTSTAGYEAAQGIEKLVGSENYGGISSFQTPNNWPL